MDELDSSVFQYLSDNGYRTGYKNNVKKVVFCTIFYDKIINVTHKLWG